jgi:uncharacterized protein YpmB
MKTKVTLITLAIFAVVGLMVYGLTYGIGNRKAVNSAKSLPSDAAARAFVLEQKLLTNVTEVRAVKPAGPEFKVLSGLDASGAEKVVFLTGTDNHIVNEGSVFLKDGVPREQIVEKMKEKGIPPEQTQDLVVTRHNYATDKVIWFGMDKDIKRHMLFYDFKTGDLIWEAYEDPTAWKLGK